MAPFSRNRFWAIIKGYQVEQQQIIYSSLKSSFNTELMMAKPFLMKLKQVIFWLVCFYKSFFVKKIFFMNNNVFDKNLHTTYTT